MLSVSSSKKLSLFLKLETGPVGSESQSRSARLRQSARKIKLVHSWGPTSMFQNTFARRACCTDPTHQKRRCSPGRAATRTAGARDPVRAAAQLFTRRLACESHVFFSQSKVIFCFFSGFGKICPKKWHRNFHYFLENDYL